ncbi:type IV pilus modification protein PilV [Methylibium petroleiphilum]|uniref:Fimbrial biogenesis protein n=1 Tax=Methylibium petroleiphilum (strain ATCC BAA-1232 / LMG 22953 / PM1) TaxID=420662 RepID=A2SLB9_METPP|nr:type IV pilus modification protein PilV [Methylibium petroleiphilum]ABM96358.1 fimbrial biogenesis protein [Methylibium petroleiphilum PM1]
MNQALSLPSASKNRRQRGSTLLEVLVAVLIFSFGILGLVAMQVRATQYSVDAEDRNRAALFADDLAAQMRLARTVSLGADAITAWTKRVQGIDLQTDVPNGLGLPNATVLIVPNAATNRAQITISWRHPRQPIGDVNRLTTEVVLTVEEVT